MSVLSKLKLVTGKRQSSRVDPVVRRRHKMVAKLDEQIQICMARQQGTVYAPTKARQVRDDATGQVVSVQTPKRLREWFWQLNGKYLLSVRYGSKVLVLNAKGANAIELATLTELVSTLTALRDAAMAGELDEVLMTASQQVRAGFGK